MRFLERKTCLRQAGEASRTTSFLGIKPINKKPHLVKKADEVFRAKDEARTRDNQLGRLELYQLSYFRSTTVQI